MSSALSPRDIQTRIRAGASLEELAQESEVPIERIEPFAAPVLAEREHVAGTALQCPVRRRGETGSVRAMRAVVSERLASQGIDVDEVEWDSWRHEDRRWSIAGRYQRDDEQREALFLFDQRARFSVASNDEARWLIGEQGFVPGPAPHAGADSNAGAGSPDAEPTIDLSDELALVRAIQGAGDEESAPQPSGPVEPAGQASVPTVPAAQQEHQAADASLTAAPQIREVVSERERVVFQEVHPGTEETEVEDYAPAELEQVDGVYDIVPTTANDMDVLYEMLSSFAEDSVNIYAGLTNPVAPAADEPSPAADGFIESGGGLRLVATPDGEETSDERTSDQQRIAATSDGDGLRLSPDETARELAGEESLALHEWAAEAAEAHPTSQTDTQTSAQEGEEASEEDESAAEPVLAAVEDAERPGHRGPGINASSSVAQQVRSNDELAARRQTARDAAASNAAVVHSTPGAVADHSTEPAPGDGADSPARLPSPAEIAARAAAVDSDTPSGAERRDQRPTVGQPEQNRPEEDRTHGAVQPATTSSDGSEGSTGRCDETATAPAPAADAQATTPSTPSPTTRSADTGAGDQADPDSTRTEPDTGAEAGPLDEAVAAEGRAVGSADDQPSPAQPSPAKPKPRPKKKRASVPSWDEIMFGGPSPRQG